MSSEKTPRPSSNQPDPTRSDASAFAPGRTAAGGTPPSATLRHLVDRVPEGWTTVAYEGRRYGMSRTTRAGGRSVKVYAEELGGSDVISANVYQTSDALLLRSCEIPDAKVLAFLHGWEAVDGPEPSGA